MHALLVIVVVVLVFIEREVAVRTLENPVTVQAVEAVLRSEGTAWALRCDRMALLR